MKKEQVIVIGLSTLVILVPALLIASAFFIAKHWFLIPFLVSAAAFWIAGQISNMFFDYKTTVDLQKLRLKEIEMLNEQSIETSCSYCKDRNVVPIRLNERNTFSCKACKQTNLVIFQFATAQITTPLQEPQLGAINGQPVAKTPSP